EGRELPARRPRPRRRGLAAPSPRPRGAGGYRWPCMRTLCFGEVLVDLVCEHAVDSPSQADAFVPRFGGDVANAAVTAARAGAQVALSGAAGDDAWGAWLRDRLADEGVVLDWFALLDGVSTPVAFVTVDSQGEPAFVFYGHSTAAGARLPEALAACDA